MKPVRISPVPFLPHLSVAEETLHCAVTGPLRARSGAASACALPARSSVRLSLSVCLRHFHWSGQSPFLSCNRKVPVHAPRSGADSVPTVTANGNRFASSRPTARISSAQGYSSGREQSSALRGRVAGLQCLQDWADNDSCLGWTILLEWTYTNMAAECD
jgi:hypothetical protein